MSRNWSWYRPASLDEAVGLLIAHGADSVIVAGATSVGLNPPRRDGIAMIDLQGIGLRTIERFGETISLGAMVTAQDLVKSDDLDAVGSGILRDTGLVMGPTPVRNKITVGGNVMQLFRWSDLPVALLVLDAHVGLYGPKGSRSIAVEELVATQPKRQLRPGELMNWVVVSVDKPGEGGCFVKLSMTAIDHAVASAAAKVGLEGEICRSARVAVGALAPLPQRLHEVEAALVDKPLDDGVIAEAAALTASARVVGERRADEAYKRQVAEVLVARALTAARDRAARRGEAGGPC